jgi:hypothetical protein
LIPARTNISARSTRPKAARYFPKLSTVVPLPIDAAPLTAVTCLSYVTAVNGSPIAALQRHVIEMAKHLPCRIIPVWGSPPSSAQ